MKKIFVAACCAALLAGLSGNAMAWSFTDAIYQYTPDPNDPTVIPISLDYNYGTDNSDPTWITDSSLTVDFTSVTNSANNIVALTATDTVKELSFLVTVENNLPVVDSNGDIIDYSPGGSAYLTVSFGGKTLATVAIATTVAQTIDLDFKDLLFSGNYSGALEFTVSDPQVGELWITNVLMSGAVVEPGSTAPVPEPATLLSLGIGLAGLALVGRRKIS